ncbi:MAG: MATE family efflux transporter [Pseudomonadales bacterium]|nr:MATE family efflux transporter [Pseudomonadales bacterium]
MTATEHPHAYHALLRLLLPLWLTQLLQMGHGVVDTVMAGHVSAPAMAAVAVGSGLWLPLLLFINGVLLANLPLLAEARGAQRWGEVPRIVHQGLMLAVILGLGAMLVLGSAPLLFSSLHIGSDLAPSVTLYLHGISLGIPAVCMFMVLRAYSESLGHPVPVTIISLATLILNIPLNMLFIHGWGPIPAMGGAGCGYATACVYWVSLLMLALWISWAPSYQQTRWFSLPIGWDAVLLKRILHLGLPLGASLFFEVSIFALIAVILAPLGPITVAGHQIALNVSSLLFMLPLSLSNALTMRTGFYTGARDVQGLLAMLRAGLKLTLMIAFTNAALLIGLRHWLPTLYTQDQAAIALARHLLIYTACFQVFDAIQVSATGVLRGLKDTRGPFWITLIAYWGLALPLGYTLGMTSWWGPARGAPGYWSGLVLGLGIAACLLSWRLKQHLSKTILKLTANRPIT